VTGDSGRAVWLEQACSYLRGAGPVLPRLIHARPEFDSRAWLARLPAVDLLGARLFQVIGQQLSVPATRRTLARIGALFDGHLPAPAGLLAVDSDKLREAGLSWRRIGTLRDVAERLSDGRLDQAALSGLLTVAGQIVAGTSFDPERFAERRWQVVHGDRPREAEFRFTGEWATS
jgi:DNA-3-methyladenine glycosylase II